jgi:hypothetical protein
MWYYTSAQPRILRLSQLLIAGVLLAASTAAASTPDWLRQAAQTPVPSYADQPDAVVLLDEHVLTVTGSGELRTTHRKAYKILRPKGRKYGTLLVPFSSDTQLSFLKAWSITERGEEYEAKDKDSIEANMFAEALYADTRYKLLQIAGANTGSVIGFEYQQRDRSVVLQDIWAFQAQVPVLRSRYLLELPPHWTYTAYWFNHSALSPAAAGENRWSWELADIPPIEPQPDMPTWRALAGHLGISLTPPGTSGKSYGGWDEIGRWYTTLSSQRREMTPQVRAKAQEIVAGVDDPIEKIHRIAAWVQHNIRYVAVEIGVGGYQPHAAQEVLTSGYGDCKDKATLLSAMLRAIGIDSYYLLINSERDFLAPSFPTMLSFDHVILAIRLPEAAPAHILAAMQHDRLGSLLLFDPTDELTAFPYLPPRLQDNYGLLVTDAGGELLKLPLIPPTANRLLRVGKLDLDSSGTLHGSIQEVRTGPYAASLRHRLLSVPSTQREKVFENILADLVDGAALTSAKVGNLNGDDDSMSLEYAFTVPGFAQQSGNLVLFHPCALGHKSNEALAPSDRKVPVIFDHTISESDALDISYPAEYVVDEVPHAMNVQSSFATYKTQVANSEHSIHYTRTYMLKSVRVPVEQLKDLREFFRTIADDERSFAILQARAASH